MHGIIDSMGIYFTYFSVGALIPTFFDLFLAYLFLFSIKEKSRSTFHLGIAFLYVAFFNMAYFIAASFYAPGAAYHRWMTVILVTLSQAHFCMFILNLPNELSRRTRTTLLAIMYGVSIITAGIFYAKTLHAGTIFYFTGHYWDFDADAVSKFVAYVIMSYVALLIGIMIWKLAVIKTRDRWIIFLIGVTLLVVSVVPSIMNTMSRDGAIDRGTYQVAWDIFNTIGLFSLSIIYINYTTDRTSFMSKIVGISLVTMLLILQGLSYFSFADKETAYDAEHKLWARFAISSGQRPDDMAYLVSYSLDKKSFEPRYLNGATMKDVTSALDTNQLLNTALCARIAGTGDASFRDDTGKLLAALHPAAAGYRYFIERELTRIAPGKKGAAAGLLDALARVRRTVLVRYNKISKIQERDFRSGMLDFLDAEAKTADFKPFIRALRDHLQSSGSQGKALKAELLEYLLPMEPPGARLYRAVGKSHQVSFITADLERGVLHEAGFSYRTYRAYLHPFSIKLITMLAAILVIIIIFFRFFFLGSLVNPLRNLLEGLDQIRQGNLDIQIPVKVDDEIGTLTKNFNRMAASIRTAKEKIDDYTNNLEQMVSDRTAKLEKAMDALWGEMQIAKKIQTVLLPKSPLISGYEIAAHMAPADEVGGDYYDVINAAGRDWVVIGDVSGHGVPAGLIMMMVQTAIHVTLSQHPDLHPADLLTVINRTIADNIRQLEEDKYMTLMVMASHKDGRFSFAGLHQDIMIYRSASRTVEIVETNGMWIGLVDDISGLVYDESFSLGNGDTLLLFTDGITEARDVSNRMFSSEQLAAILGRVGGGRPAEIMKAIIDALSGYRCDDDVTLMVVNRVG